MQPITDDAIRKAPRLCFFAHYHPQHVVADYVLIYLRALADAGFTTVVMSTADLPEEEQARLSEVCALLIMRKNIGLDFGGWIEAYQRFTPIEAEFLLFANDSVYAPLGDLAAFIERLTETQADFYGAVESLELESHLQSWFLLLRPQAYNAPAFKTLMAQSISPDMPKTEIIRRYECGLTRCLTETGLRYHAAYSQMQRGPIARGEPFNPTHLLWYSLIAHYGIPFLKVELMRDNPMRMGRLKRWRALARKGPSGLEQAIAVDIASRNSRAQASLLERVHWSIGTDNPVYWPEFNHYLVRDSRSKNIFIQKANYWMFKWTGWIVRRIRWRLKKLRR